MPETPEEIIARRRAGRMAPAPAGGFPSPEEVIQRRRASKTPATPPVQDPGMKRALAGYVPPEQQDERMAGDFGRQAFARLATADPLTKTLSGVAAGFGDVGQSIYAPLREAADAGDPEAAARLADMAARTNADLTTKAGWEAAGRAGVDAALGSLNVLGTGVGNFGKGAEILAKGGGAVRGALSAPIATTVISGLQATPGGHKVLEAVPGAAKAGARALGVERGSKTEGAVGTAASVAPALLAAWFGKSGVPQIAKTLASEAGQVQMMSMGPEVAQAVGVDPRTAAGMALGLGSTIIGQHGAGRVERGIVERQAQKGIAKELRTLATHEEPQTPTPDQVENTYLQEMLAKDAAEKAAREAAEAPRKEALGGVAGALGKAVEGEKAKTAEVYAGAPDTSATGQPPPFRVPPGGKPPREGAGMDPEAFREAKESAVPLTPEAERINAEARRPLDDLLAESRTRAAEKQAAKDRAASEEWGREAAFDEAQAAWDALAPGERAAKVKPLFDLGVMRPGEAVKPWDRLSLDQQEHIQAVLKDPSAFADAMPEEVAPGQPKGQAEPPVGEVSEPPVPPPPAEPAAPVPEAPKPAEPPNNPPPPTTEPAARPAPPLGERAPTVTAGGAPKESGTEIGSALNLDKILAQATFRIRGRTYSISPHRGKYQLLRDAGPKNKGLVEPVTGLLTKEELRPLLEKVERGEPLPEWPNINEPGGPAETVAKWDDNHLEELIRNPYQGIKGREHQAEMHESLPMVRAAKAELAKRAARTIDVTPPKEPPDALSPKPPAPPEIPENAKAPQEAIPVKAKEVPAPTVPNSPAATARATQGQSGEVAGTNPRRPWEMTKEEFGKLAVGGALHQRTGKLPPFQVGSRKTPLSMGESEGYSDSDIAAFYLSRRSYPDVMDKSTEPGIRERMSDRYTPEALESAYAQFMADARTEGKAIPPKPGGSTFLGSGLGGLQKSYESLSPEQRRLFDRTLKTIVGGVAGYGIGDLTDERMADTPEGRTLYRLIAAGIGGYFGMGSPGWTAAWNALAKGANKTGISKGFVNPREAISPEGAEVIRAADRRGSVANIDASVIAHGLPKIPDEILYPYLGGELGSARAYRDHLASLGPEAAAQADAAVEAAKTVIRELSKERAALGGIAEETHGERYAGAEGAKILEAGFLNRILMEKFAEGAKPSFFGAKANRPKLWKESVREDGHGAIVAIDAATVHEILQEAGIDDPWMTRHGTVLQKGNNTLVKWAPTPEGKYQRDLFLESLKDYARQQAEVMVGPGKTGGVGHIAQRLTDAPGLRVTLSRPQIKKMLGEYGIPAPESIEASGQRHAVRWADTPDGMAAADAFEVALRDFAQAESTVRLGKGASGGTSHLVLREFDPLPLEVRKALGEVGFAPGGAKAQTFLTTARLGHQVANLKMYEGIAAGKDAKGEWTVPVPEGEIPKVKDPVSGEMIQTVDGPGGEYVVVPGDRGTWGALAGKAVRKDWWDYLSVTKRIADSSEAGFQQFMGRWRAGKITTSRGLTRNFVGNLYFSHLAKTAPYFVDSLPHYIRVGRDFINALRTGNLAPLRQYVEKYGIEVYPEDLTGDPHANETIRMVRDAAIDSTKLRSGAKGRIAGDIVTGGMLSEGIGKIPGPAVAGTLGAAANVGYGLIKGESGDDLWKRAAIGGAAGAAGNLAYRQLARAYGLTDAYFKAVAGETLVRRGMSLKDARIVVRERFQNFKEMTPLEETISGRKPGAWQIVGLFSNPFARFYTQLVRTTVNTARKDPAAAATGILLLPILAEGFEKGMGVFGPGQEEERRAAHNLNPSSIHYRRDGKLEKVDIGPILPWSDMAEDVRGLVTNDSSMGKSARDLFSMTLGGGPVAETIRAPMVLSGGPETKDLRSGFPIGEPGESGGDAFARTLMQTWFHPSTPGAGTDWKRAEEQITEKFKKGSRKQPLEPGRTALALGLGMNTGEVDFDKTLRQLRAQRDREFEEAERRIDRALNDRQFRSDPERVRRQRALYREEIAAAKKRYLDAKSRLIPSPVGR